MIKFGQSYLEGNYRTMLEQSSRLTPAAQRAAEVMFSPEKPMAEFEKQWRLDEFMEKLAIEIVEKKDDIGEGEIASFLAYLRIQVEYRLGLPHNALKGGISDRIAA